MKILLGPYLGNTETKINFSPKLIKYAKMINCNMKNKYIPSVYC